VSQSSHLKQVTPWRGGTWFGKYREDVIEADSITRRKPHEFTSHSTHGRNSVQREFWSVCHLRFTQLIALQPGFGGKPLTVEENRPLKRWENGIDTPKSSCSGKKYSAGGSGSVNGTRVNQVNWQIDGVDNNDLWHNLPAVNQGGVSSIAGTALPIDAIEEFSVQTQSSREAGRNPGAAVNLVIKSGGNDVHGSAYYYNRNEAFAAAPFFLPDGTSKPRMRNEHWGSQCFEL
jgi:hypothetical protein